ncbi:uncharacterized protein Eint_110820 [Encephalitozoon intestinalis ATCC 50506]|uniref:Uncharacterized protein n=1 Tax=Encephalitozoon intestinalis (strain ATCC 50506) TaxID=876142 RepID=E0SAF7_ENCIT|nr:uncharacterized protein Eint_110820 [Encephalitozoon intestinalis ATCC 50506]ADM12582.1 hypothetical protein Eint_110820 [Encephalitozoon intestinalis ATCC 50506]UTX46439.1 hypothetical protein GPK93_11g20490 [Encephalitozoon intestinalis]
MGGKNFMTSKEKDYVAECLKRNMRYFRSDIDYAVLFREGEEKIEVKCDDGEPKRSVNLIFGKENKKSSRRPRPFCGVEVENIREPMRDMFLLEELIDLYTARRYCKLSPEDLRENIEMFREKLLCKFDVFISIAKFVSFLGEYFPFAEEEEKKEVVVLLLRTFHLVKDVPSFYNSIGSLAGCMPQVSEAELEEGFVSTFLFFPSGLILATLLLIQNEALCGVFYEAIIKESGWSFTKSKHGWQFLSVMISIADEEKQKSIVRKARPYLSEVSKEPESDEAKGARLFLEAIGIDMEDLRCWGE